MCTTPQDNPLDYPGRTPLIADPATPGGRRALTYDEAVAAVRTYFDLFTELRVLLRDHELDDGGAAADTRMVRDDPMDYDEHARPMLAIGVADVERILDRAPQITLTGGKSAGPWIAALAAGELFVGEAGHGKSAPATAMLFLGGPDQRSLDDVYTTSQPPPLLDAAAAPDTIVLDALGRHPDGITLDRLIVCLADHNVYYSSYAVIAALGTLVAQGRASIYAPEEGGAPVYQRGALTLAPQGLRILIPLAVALAEHLDVHRLGSTLQEMATWVDERFVLSDDTVGPNLMHLTIALAWLAEKRLATHPVPGRDRPYFAPRHSPFETRPAGTPS